MKRISTFILTFLFIWNIQGQQITNTTRQIISSKAAKGELMEYYINKETKQIELIYKTKETKKKMVLETYYFNQSDLSFIKSTEEEVIKEKVKWRRKKVKGGEEIKLLKVIPNIMNGQIKLSKGYISYAYAGRALLSEFHEEMKVKPKGEDGDRLVYLHHRTEQAKLTGYGTAKGDITLGIGNVMLLAMENLEPNYASITAMVYDAHTLDRKITNKIELGYSYMPIAVRDLPNGNMGVVLRSMSLKDIPKPEYSKKLMAKFQLAPNYHLKYIEINTKCEVVYNKEIAVPEPESGYYINASISPSEDAEHVTIMALVNPFKIKGPPLGRVLPQFGVAQNRNIDLHKANKVWIIALHKGEVKYAREYSIPEILSNAVNPKAEKAYLPKSDEKSAQKYFYHGSNVIPVSILVKDNKTLLYLIKGNNLTQVMQLNDKGDIEKNYFISCDKKRIIGQDMQYHISSKGEVFIFSYDQPAPKDGSSTELAKAKENLKGYIMKIDLVNNSISSPIDLTPNANLDIYDGLFQESIDSWLSLGRGKKKEIVLSRILL